MVAVATRVPLRLSVRACMCAVALFVCVLWLAGPFTVTRVGCVTVGKRRPFSVHIVLTWDLLGVGFVCNLFLICLCSSVPRVSFCRVPSVPSASPQGHVRLGVARPSCPHCNGTKPPLRGKRLAAPDSAARAPRCGWVAARPPRPARGPDNTSPWGGRGSVAVTAIPPPLPCSPPSMGRGATASGAHGGAAAAVAEGTGGKGVAWQRAVSAAEEGEGGDSRRGVITASGTGEPAAGRRLRERPPS